MTNKDRKNKQNYLVSCRAPSSLMAAGPDPGSYSLFYISCRLYLTLFPVLLHIIFRFYPPQGGFPESRPSSSPFIRLCTMRFGTKRIVRSRNGRGIPDGEGLDFFGCTASRRTKGRIGLRIADSVFLSDSRRRILPFVRACDEHRKISSLSPSGMPRPFLDLLPISKTLPSSVLFRRGSRPAQVALLESGQRLRSFRFRTF